MRKATNFLILVPLVFLLVLKGTNIILENYDKFVPLQPKKEVIKQEIAKEEVVKAEAQPPVKDPPPEVKQDVKIKLYTPDSSVRFAAADLATITPSEQEYIRYLSLYNIPPDKRKLVAETVSFLVNSLGTRRKMYIPIFVGNSDETVIRLNIKDYDWKPKAWEDLAKKGSGVRPQPEPYFHAFIEKLIPGVATKKKGTKEVTKTKKVLLGYDQRGQPVYRDEEYKETVETETDVPGEAIKQKVFAGAPWIDATALGALIKGTQSESPILRADWFIVNASLPPAYYDFLGLGKTLKDFQNLIFADDEKAQKAKSQDKGIVVTSEVARNNRTLLRSPTFTKGYYWVSHDSLKSVDDRQYVQQILDEQFDATEDIGTLPNGLQAYFLTDGKGNRLDAANTDIAIDNTAIDRIVRTGRSCIVCHAEGIRPIVDEVRTLTKKLQNKEQVKLLITNDKDAYKIDDLFGSDLDEQIILDQNFYSSAIAKTNGLKANVNAKQFGSLYDNYAEIVLTKDIVAREVGVPVDELDKYIKLSTDNVVLGLVRNPIRPIRRDQWENSFQSFMLVVIAGSKGER